jgi:uncharacterized RDD family membrane protein YckC
MALWLVLGLALAVSGYLLNPLRSSEIEGWPGGAVVYVVESVVMLGWYGGWQAGVGGTPGMLLLRLRVPRPERAGKALLRRSRHPQLAAGPGEFRRDYRE